jgi:uncharacterized circularly permuted ATP-grasp superfamily protein/uncharacterized alpha-E superfamily protein
LVSESISADYRVHPGTYDELLAPDGSIRDTWKSALGSEDFASPATLETRWRAAERMIREHGVTYNVYDDPRGMARPWPLDPVPAIIPVADWQVLEAGLIQRTRLLERLAADLYGEQSALHSGLLPPGLVFANPGFIRPCHGTQPADGRQLHLIGFDVGRLPDGSWVVLDDRTQAPSGAGYALENRMVISRNLPEAFRAQPVARLASFFRALRGMLIQAASIAARNSRGDGSEPRIVLLTPGPYNETYFEHAYLARYLGFPLVTGADLTVRYDRVYLKTLGGLQPVDGILRRLDADYCDPLWLRPDSTLGVPGLIAAARRGHVAICNPLGAGIVEGAGLLPYLPALARRLIGEDLILPQAETRWLGAQGALDGIDAELDQLVVKPAFSGLNQAPRFGDELDGPARAALLAELAASPGRHAVQRRLALSCTPVWQDGALVSRPLVLRTYVAATADGGHMVMPGGLARVSTESRTPVVSLQRGGGSKDCWVLTDRREEYVSLWQSPSEHVHDETTEALRRSGTDLPSRVADNLFWLGRYAERSEVTVRFARALRQRAGPDLANAASPAAPILAQGLIALGIDLPTDGPSLVRFQPSQFQAALAPPIEALHRAATSVRDRLSNDTWRALNALPALGNLDQMLARLAAFNGLVMENMTRGLGWRFLEIGRRLERAYQTLNAIRLLGSQQGPAEEACLEALLEICDSSMTYRSRYFSGLRAAAVFDLVLADDSNPRAVAFQCAAIVEHVASLPREQQALKPQWTGTPEAHVARGLVGAIQQADMDRLARPGLAGETFRPLLDQFCTRSTEDLAHLSDLLSTAYFEHAAAGSASALSGAA